MLKKLNVQVGRIIRETPFVKRFSLRALDDVKLPPFSPGSHIAVYAGGFERNYSLVNHSNDRSEYEIAIRLDERSEGGSAFWHNNVKQGDPIEISFPKNHFPLSFRAKHHALFAAGIGITPFMAMMAKLRQKGGSFELHYGARSAQCAFHETIQHLYPYESHFYFSQSGNQRRMTTDLLLNQPIGTHVYFCGPEQMISEFADAAHANGYPESSIHFERFAAKQPVDPKPFRARLAKSKRELLIPENKTLLEILLESGIEVPYSCRVGECGTCELEVLAGKVEHYDSFLSEREKKKQDTILACVSRGCSRELILNL